METRNILNYLGDVIGSLTLPDSTSEEVWEEKLLKYASAPAGDESFYQPSFAVDKDGVDQLIEDEEWAVISGPNVLWDTQSNYDISNDDFIVGVQGIYLFDGQFKITDMENVATIEIAIFKREDPEDDYWFILNKRNVVASSGETQMSGMTSLDFRANEKYTVKIKVTKSHPMLSISAKISGSDDYTAWGYNFIRKL